MFTNLNRDEAWQGIFYIEANPSQPLRNERVGALCFLIGSSGLVVTCSHVVLENLTETSETLVLNAAFAPIMVKAKILREGWSGPQWRRDEGDISNDRRVNASRTSSDWAADIAFLQLLPDTAEFNGSGITDVKEKGSPTDCLLKNGKVLSLAAPGYFPKSKTHLTAHHIVYSDEKTPERFPSLAEFRSFDSSSSGTVILGSDRIKNGDSGGPIWDKERRRVVAMVRRGAKILPNTELAADSRTISELSGIPMEIDDDANALLTTLKDFHTENSLSKHFTLLSDLLEGSYVDLKIKQIRSSPEPHDVGSSAIETILFNKGMDKCRFLLGGPGSGKSRLLQEATINLLEEKKYLPNKKRLIPLIFHAKDYEKFGLSTKKLLNHVTDSIDTEFFPRRTPHEILYQNDLALLVLIDGLDEITVANKAKLLAQLNRLKEKQKTPTNLAENLDALLEETTSFIVATRPVEDLRITAQPNGQSYPVLELQPLGSEEIEAFFGVDGHDEKTLKTLGELAEILSWGHSGPTPLQIAFLVHYSKHLELGSIGIDRPVDLHLCLARHLVALGEKQDQRDRSSRMRAIKAELWSVLGAVASSFLKGNTTLSKIIESSEIAELEFERQDVRDFVLYERKLLGAVVSTVGATVEDASIVWPHRSVAEAFSAQYLAKQSTSHVKAAEIFNNLPDTSQSLEVLFLALIDQTHDQGDFASNLISRKVKDGLASKRVVWFALRVLAAGIRLKDHEYKLLVTLLMKILYHSTGGRSISPLFSMLCSELLSTSGAGSPEPVKVAKMQIVRPFVLEHLNANLERRAKLNGFARLSSYEAKLINELNLIGEISVSILPPDNRNQPDILAPFNDTIQKGPLPSKGLVEIDDDNLGYFASRLLAHDPEGFIDSFRAHLSKHPTSKNPADVLRDFIAEYRSSFR